MSLKSKKIVVTGAGRGLGYAYAHRLGSEGATIVIAEIDEMLGHAAERSLLERGVNATFVQTDISDERSVSALATAAGTEIHGLVCNAGWANNVGGRSYLELDVATWDRMMSINVRGTWLTVRALAPRMTDGGSIVIISSDVVTWGPPKLLHYVTSKSALLGMTRSLATELGPRTIRVNALLPGLTIGEATKDIPKERWDDYNRRKLIARPQVPEDLDGVVSFLMNDNSRYMTGQMLCVDGGFALY
jgi:NAD(P)-dependent dehydrogenase (short-subunit alcohol dehydrogenase family)